MSEEDEKKDGEKNGERPPKSPPSSIEVIREEGSGYEKEIIKVKAEDNEKAKELYDYASNGGED